MKKIIPYKQNVFFKTNVSEIVSISLEHTLKLESELYISGDFIISGSYKMTETSINTEEFTFNLPFDIALDEKYDTTNITIDIEDFYYELVNNNSMIANIEVGIDSLEEKEIKVDILEEVKEREVVEPFKIIENEVEANIEKNDYTTYYVYIMREEDTIESVLAKYQIDEESVRKYNDLTNVKKGDKIIIPYIRHE